MHTTQYGNSYTDEEWATMQQGFATDRNSMKTGADLKAQFKTNLVAAGISEQGAKFLTTTTIEWEDLEDAGRIAWENEAKRQAAYEARERYYDANELLNSGHNDIMNSLWVQHLQEG